MDGHYVVCKLTKLIEYRCNALELVFLERFEDFTSRYDADTKYIKEQLKTKFAKITRHLDESIFTILHKGHRLETDLEQIYKKMLKLFVAPNHQNITRTMFLKERQCPTVLEIAEYLPPACECREKKLPCDFEKNPEKKCGCFPEGIKKKEVLESEEKVPCLPVQKDQLDKPTCLPGKNQSPVEIVEFIPIKMPAIELIGYRNLLAAPVTLKNDGISVVLSARKLTAREVKLGEFVPYVTGGKLGCAYQFEQLHFHWGNTNDCGSEHVLNNIRHPLEMHIVHINKKYKSREIALKKPDGFVVLAVFFQISDFDGHEIQKIVEQLVNLQNEDDTVEMEMTFSLFSLLGAINLDQFYTYKGSITTPPYSESVTWVIFPDALKISTFQINEFRQLCMCGCENVNGNFRELQPLGNRRIFLRKSYPEGCSTNIEEMHHTKWGWYK